MRTAAAVILCAWLCGACALPPPPPSATGRSDSEERDREAIQNFFDGLREVTLAGGFDGQLYIPESDRETLLSFLDRLKDIALLTGGDRTLSREARNKLEFLAVLELLEESVRNADEEEAAFKEAFAGVVEEMRTVARAQPDDAPPRWSDFRSPTARLLELARARGAAGDHLLDLFISIMDSTFGEIPLETDN